MCGRRRDRGGRRADEERVAGEDGAGSVGQVEIGHDDADALDGVAGGLQEAKHAAAELEGVAVLDGGAGECCAGAGADIDGGAGALSELAVAGDEVGVEMGLDDVLDLETEAGGGFDIDIDVALGVDNGGDTFRTDQVGGVREAAKVELFQLDRHGESL